MKINHEKITEEFCRDKILAFFPATAGEAAMIQYHFLKMGHVWKTGDRKVILVDECVSRGMAIRGEKIYTHPHALDSLENVYLCKLEQLADNYVSTAETFNNLAQRVEKLEEYLKPKELDKPFPKKPPLSP